MAMLIPAAPAPTPPAQRQQQSNSTQSTVEPNIRTRKPSSLSVNIENAYEEVKDNEIKPREDKLRKRIKAARRYIAKEDLEQPSFKAALQASRNYIAATNALSADRSDFPDTETGKLATQARVSIDFAIKNPEETQKKIDARKLQRQNLLPDVANAIANNPSATNILRDDIDNFNRLHAILNYEEHIEGDSDAGFFDKLLTAWNSGSAIADMADYSDDMSDALSQGLPIPDDIAREMSDLNLIASSGTRDGNILSQMAVATSQILKPLIDSAGHAIAGGAGGAIVGAGAGSLFMPGVGTGIGAGIGAKIGGISGFTKSTYDQTYASTAFHYANLEVDGQKLDSEIVNASAQIESLISTGLDMLSFAVLGDVTGVAGSSVRTVISSALATPAGKAVIAVLGSKLAKGALGVAGATGTEAAVEGTQEIILDAFAELAKQWTSEKRGGEYKTKGIFRPEVIDRAKEAAILAMKATPLLAVGGIVTMKAINNFRASPIGNTVNDIVGTLQEEIELENQVNNDLRQDSGRRNLFEVMADMDSFDTSLGTDTAGSILRGSEYEFVYMDYIQVEEKIEELAKIGKTQENTEWIADIQLELEAARNEGRELKFPLIYMFKILKEKDGGIFEDIIKSNIGGEATLGRENVSSEKLEEIYSRRNDLISDLESEIDVLSLGRQSFLALKKTGVLSDSVAKSLSILIPRWAVTATHGTDIMPDDLVRDFGLKIEGAYKNFKEKDFDDALGSYDPDDKSISLSNKQDLSTFLHEVSHFFLDFELSKNDLSKIEPIFTVMAMDLGVSESDIRNALSDPESNKKLFTDAHEYFAKKFEAYIINGEPPTQLMVNEFREWSDWLRFNYNENNPLGVDIDNDAQLVFDSLLTNKPMGIEERNQVKRERILLQSILDENQDAPNDLTFEEETVTAITRSAISANAEAYDKAKKDAIKDATNIVDKDPIYLLDETVRNDEWFKLDRKEIMELLGLSELPPKLLEMSEENANSIADVVSALGIFQDKPSIQVITELLNLPTKDKRINQIAKQIIDNNPDILTMAKIKEQATSLLRDKNAERALLGLIDAVPGENLDPKQKYNQAAIDYIRNMKLKYLGDKIKQIKAQAKRTSQLLAVALNSNDAVATQKNAQDSLIHLYTLREARLFTLKINGIRKLFNKYKTKKAFDKIEVDGQDFAPRVRELLSIAGILEPIYTNGNKIKLLDDMTVGEIYALRDTIESIEVAAENAKYMLLGNEKVKLKETVEKIVSELDANTPVDIDLSSRINGEQEQKGAIKSSIGIARTLISQVTIVPWIIKSLTNPLGTEQSVTQEAIDTPLTLAMEEYNNLLERHLKPVVDAFISSKKDLNQWLDKTYKINSLIGNISIDNDASGNLTGRHLLAFVLNIGTQKNLEKLLKGYEIIGIEDIADVNNPVVQEIIGKLNKEQWDIVNIIWKQMDSLFPQLQKISKSHKGFNLVKEEGLVIPLADGTVIKGGYYPLFKDNNIVESESITPDSQASTDQLFSPDIGMDSLDTSAMYERTNAIYPVSLSIGNNVAGHFRQVIHYVSHYEAVDSVNKVISHPDFRRSFQRVAGARELNELNMWLKDVANNSSVRNPDIITNFFQRIRYGATLGILGFKYTTVIKQLYGLSNASVEVGEGSALKGASRLSAGFLRTATYIGNGDATKGAKGLTAVYNLLTTSRGGVLFEDMISSSSIMKHRQANKTFDINIAEATEIAKGDKGLRASWNNIIMGPIAMMQFHAVDVPVWIAARQTSYDNAMLAGKPENEALALSARYADSVVTRTQSSSIQKDLPRLLRKQSPEITRTALIFMTAMMSLHNQSADSIRGINRGNYSKINGFMRLFMVLIAPGIIEELVKAVGNDDNDELIKKIGMKSIAGVAGVIPIAPAIIGAAQGFSGNIGAMDTAMKGVAPALILPMNLYSYVIGEKSDDMSEKNIKNVILLGSILSGYGGGLQAGNSITGLWDSLDNWDRRTGVEIADSILNGPRKHKKKNN